MKTKRVTILSALVLLLGLATLTLADDQTVTVTGNLACAKCTLKKADMKGCQDVLVVTGNMAGEYYLVKNAVLDNFGHTCKGQKTVTATGTISEKDGKKWLTATDLMVASS